MNNVKTFLLMGALMALFLAAGQAIGGSQGLVTAFVMGSLDELRDVFLLGQARPADVRREDWSPRLRRRSSTGWWTACGSGPDFRCRSWPWRRTNSPTRSPPAGARDTPSWP